MTMDQGKEKSNVLQEIDTRSRIGLRVFEHSPHCLRSGSLEVEQEKTILQKGRGKQA